MPPLWGENAHVLECQSRQPWAGSRVHGHFCLELPRVEPVNNMSMAGQAWAWLVAEGQFSLFMCHVKYVCHTKSHLSEFYFKRENSPAKINMKTKPQGRRKSK